MSSFQGWGHVDHFEFCRVLPNLKLPELLDLLLFLAERQQLWRLQPKLEAAKLGEHIWIAARQHRLYTTIIRRRILAHP